MKIFTNPRHQRELERDIQRMALPNCQLCQGRGFTGTEIGTLKNGRHCENKVACVCIKSHENWERFEMKWSTA